jgi:predicted kinase
MVDKTTTGTLFIFSGLPGTGKSELARDLSRRLGAVYLRIDTIEQALRDQGQDLKGPEGYVVAHKVAGDNLRLGLDVVADSVNPWQLTREAWRDVARGAGADFRDIEVVCSDEAEHRRRVESREGQVPGLRLPSWQDVLDRRYEPWLGERIVLDTAGRTPAQSKEALLQALAARGG